MTSPDLQRIKHIRDYCIAIQNTIRRYGDSFALYSSDPDYQRSVAFSLMQIGELSGGLSDEFKKSTADRVPWNPIKAMRNFFAHNYGKMDQAVIWETATKDIPGLLQFCNERLAEQ